MKSVLLIGLGRFGRHIATKLNQMNHQVMAVDSDEERVNAVLPYVTNAQIGDSTNWEFLDSLGVRNYDACIVAIGDDFQNSLETASLLKEMGARKVRCTSDHILDYIELDKEYSIFELSVPGEWRGKTILQLDIRKKYGINILGIRKNGNLNMNVTPETVFEDQESILVLGQQKKIQKCFHI